ncbi:MAG: pyruvate oxidase [Arcanobacterium sp.]|nr:pyruvate oxidase [Arcanobacterium sp.]
MGVPAVVDPERLLLRRTLWQCPQEQSVPAMAAPDATRVRPPYGYARQYGRHGTAFTWAGRRYSRRSRHVGTAQRTSNKTEKEETMATINAADAMMKVLESWGVKRIYGLPGGSLDSTMNAIHNYRDRIHYVGVRHEEAGALAAVAEAKLTGRIGVTLGSAGPGAVHLLNGLYDAKTDHIPVLALIGQVPSSRMNLDFFQEMPENPMFADVAVYNRTVMTPQQLPLVIDAAIREAYEQRGVAVVVIPKDFGWAEIDDTYPSSANSFAQPQWVRAARDEDVQRTLDLLITAKRPYIYFGQGARPSGEALRELSDLLKVPLGSTYLGKPTLEGDEPAWMLSTGRVSTKPGVDVARNADTVLFLGTNFEFPAFNPHADFIDVNLRPSTIGKRHKVALGIMADVNVFLQQLREAAQARATGGVDLGARHQGWYAAAVEDRAQWDAWIERKAQERDISPARFEPLYAAINKIADPDAIFGVDVGNVNIATGRFLHMDHEKTFVTSPLYATMGFGVPAGIAAALEFPGREVWTLSGDGGFAMMSQDLITQRDQHLPIINVVFSNSSLGFIEAEQDDTQQPHSGVKISDVDFATVAQGFGVTGYTVRSAAEFEKVLSDVKGTREPVVIDVKITNDRLLPVEKFPTYAADMEGFEEFRAQYDAGELETFGEILARHQG